MCGRFDFFRKFLCFFAKKNGLLALKTAIFAFFFKSVGFPTLLSHPAIFYTKGSCFNVILYISGFLLISGGDCGIRDETRWLQWTGGPLAV